MIAFIEGWKNIHLDYEIIEWNEENFDIHSNIYIEEAYNAKKWAFVTDYVRLYILYEHGGIYMDTDVEVLRPLDYFLTCHAFLGFEAPECVSTCIMGSEKGMKLNGKIQNIKDFTMYPQSYFSPNSIKMIFGKKPSKSYTIHHFFGSWLDKEKRHGIKVNIGHYIGGKVRNLIGTDRYRKLRRI